MMSENKGGICLITDGNNQDAMYTYRLTFTEWASLLGSFTQTQNSYLQGFNGKVIALVQPRTKMDYMDAYHCDGSANVFTCTAYQPDWENGQETDGYPRFGIDSQGITAGVIDTASTSPIAWPILQLKNAVTLAAAGIAATLITTF